MCHLHHLWSDSKSSPSCGQQFGISSLMNPEAQSSGPLTVHINRVLLISPASGCVLHACTQTGSDVITLDSHKQEVDLTDQMCCFWLISLRDQNQWIKNRTINNFPVRLSSVFIDVSDQFTSCLNWSLNSMCSYLWKGSNLNRQSVIDWSVKLQRMCIAHVYLFLLSLSDNQYDEDDDEITPDLWQEACWIVIR